MDQNVENGPKLDKGLGWGKSLPVPSIQEMVRNDSETIPERFIQNYENSALQHNFTDIPIIDLSLLTKGDADELNKLDFACKELGFFHIINHGVAAEVLTNVRAAQASFFALECEEKKKYSRSENDNVQGYGQEFVASDEQKMDWHDMVFLLARPPERRNLQYWPVALPGFMEAVEEYSEELQRVTEEILASMSMLMGMDENGLKRSHKVIRQFLRFNYYPPCSRPDLVLGFSPHTDEGSITIVLQDDDVTALQIKYKGSWIPVKPVPNSLVINVGDATEAWSNGIYKSIVHRTVANANKTRMSIAAFIFPDDDADIGPVESTMRDRPRMYRSVKEADYLRHRLLDANANINFLKLESQS